MNKLSIAAFLLGAATLLSSCEVIGGIFKAGMGVGILLVVVVVVLIIWLVRKMGGRSGGSTP